VRPTLRRVLPVGLLAMMSLLTLASALLAIFTGPSLAAVDLQIAEARTSAVSSFNFHLADSNPVGIGKVKTYRVSDFGTWQSPDRMKITSTGLGGAGQSTIVVNGSLVHLPNSSGYHGHIQFRIGQTTPFETNGVPLFGIPPLGLVTKATDVVQSGDIYTFKVPVADLPYGWVAYAPLSGNGEVAAGVSSPKAYDTTMTAVVRNGVIVTLSFPEGVHGGRVRIGGPEVWTLSRFSSAPTVTLP